jgi:hypothetical protein
MPNFRIFTESIADVKFLKDYIEEVFTVTLSDEDFDTLGSWSGYKAGGNLKASIKQNTENEKINILILDADADFDSRRNEVTNDFGNYNTPINLFLFPTDAAHGNLEDLLAEAAVDRRLIDCFLEYEKCVALYPKKLNHSRIYAYLDMLLLDNFKDEHGKDLRTEANRNYRNKAHWELDHEALNPLKGFLTPFFQ